SDLAPLRARLPEGSSLNVFPARGGVRPSAVFAVSDRQVVDRLRSTPGVRDVQTSGMPRDAIDVESDRDAAAIAGALEPHAIGKNVIVAPAAQRVSDLHLPFRLRQEEPSSIARPHGKP